MERRDDTENGHETAYARTAPMRPDTAPSHRRSGIKSRLLLILGLAMLAIAIASAVALVALTQIRSQVATVADRELPASEAALLLARIGERLQDRTPALMVLKDADARRRQMDLIEQDLQSLASEAEHLNRLHPGKDSDAASFSRLTRALADNLRQIAALIERQADLGRAAIGQRERLIQLRERVQQILGPSILAVTDVVDREPSAPEPLFRRAALAQGALLDAERLAGFAFGELLIATEASSLDQVRQSRRTFERIRDRLVGLVPRIPSGLRDELRAAIADLAGQLEPAGVFALRSGELAAIAEAERLEVANRRIASQLKSRVDALVRSANANIAQVAAVMGETVLANTLLFVAVSVAAILIATLLSYRLVVRDISLNLRAVTQAMQRLAEGERQARVPAMDRDDEIGDLARVFNVFKEQSFRMETLDRQLTEKSNLLLATFDNMNDGFTVFDAQERLIAWNPRYLELYGLSDAALEYGVSLAHIHARLAARGTRAFTPLGEEVALAELVSERRSLTREYEVRCPDGRLVELRSNPVPTGGFVTIHIDVSERRAMERQLRQAQKMEAVGQLTGGIAHDFNNILAALQGNLTYLEEGLKDRPELYARWKKAMGASDRAARQVERLLAFSRRQRLDPQLVDVNALVTGMLDLLEYSLGDGIVLHSELAVALPLVRIDPGQLENALMNLAINARDAMGGQGQIRIETARLSDAEVEIRVEDTGCGIPQDLIDRVFEPFFTTKSGGKGSGLGLSMVYGFVSQSGGGVTIESEPGQGARVGIRLPVCAESAVADSGTLQEEGAVADCPQGNGETLLVVDDDPALLDLTATQLESLGYSVRIAGNGAEALDVLRGDSSIRLLYTDIGLPAPWDGFALADKAREQRPGLRVLYTSGQDHDRLEVAEVLLKKPVPLDLLARTVARLLSA
ncbi:multi-sensor hybrid histidine kinase [Thiorhodococcus drewsii AZ1]|uniref:histidine kinase n=1 Tax=Thiorhodococcus drewsii AZ1 TaxID=765913 RepID=G2DXV8_9GAMM|nr:PAS-domain containing protein [Thiorhodococcus drewsii]EGV33157.1 multi-sensor hybrid histidine kinase [Thiorhodococcus drewsii AZ1]